MSVIFFYTIFLLRSIPGIQGLSDVSMSIDPKGVQQGADVLLMCHYNLEGAQLYSVKWYRGTTEFYRYTPWDQPAQKTFPFDGLNIDLVHSNSSQVYLRNVGFAVGGNVTCEVTTDAPIRTRQAYGFVEVVSLPSGSPQILVDKLDYKPGERLMANCTTYPSRPAATLRFYVNGQIPTRLSTPVQTYWHQTADNRYWSTALLEIDLFPGDFPATITCTAQIGRYHSQQSELRLGFKTRDPVPESIRSRSSSPSSNYKSALLIVLTIIFTRFESIT